MTSYLGRRRRILRTGRRLGIVAAVAATIVAVAGVAASANSGGTINSAGSSVNVRSGPGTNYSVVGSLAQGTPVSISCIYDDGTAVSGPFGTTTLWDEIGGGNRWVTDAFVNTGVNAPIAMPCTDIIGEGFSAGGPETTDVYAVPGCYFVNGGSGTNFGGRPNTPPDYFQQGSGCSSLDAYMYTYGNGTSASGDLFTWGYFVGAGAHCSIGVTIPSNDSGGAYLFDSAAHYRVVTNHNGATVLSNQTINQQTHQRAAISLGSWTADGTGYIGVTLDDSSGSQQGVRVVSQLVSFVCTSTF